MKYEFKKLYCRLLGHKVISHKIKGEPIGIKFCERCNKNLGSFAKIKMKFYHCKEEIAPIRDNGEPL